MTRIRNDSRGDGGRFVPAFATRPLDFEQQFVAIGRLACEEHYGVGRRQITRWMDEMGHDELNRLRSDQVKRNEVERHSRRLSRRDVGRILAAALPLSDGRYRHRYVNPAIAQRAARHLRIVRNGGWIISPMPDGLWRLGLRVVSAAELVEVAKAKGFDPSLTGDE